MKLKNLLSLLTKKNNYEKPAKLSFANVKGVIQAAVRKIGGFDLAPHIYEQIIWRRTEVRYHSPICWYSGNCKVCGCDILGKTMEDRACSISEHPDLMEKRTPCYPAMMGKDEWEAFKEKKNIKLFK